MYTAVQKSEHNPLLCFRGISLYKGALEGLINSFDFPASIKCPITDRFKHMNPVDTDRLGLTPAAVENKLSSFDFGRIVRLPDQVTHKLVTIDQKISHSSEPLNFLIKRHILLKSGFVMVEEAIKKPIFNTSGKKVIGIFGYCRDITHYVSPLNLFMLYAHYYNKNSLAQQTGSFDKPLGITKEGIQKFLEYKKLDHYFTRLPTTQQCRALFTMVENSASKYVAKAMQGVNYRTVDVYKEQLRVRLRDIELDELLIQIRRKHFDDISFL
jgi:hypothetical protein